MSLLDAFLLLVIIYLTLSGYRSGFIRAVGSLAGLLVGVYLASRYFQVLASAWQWLFLGRETVARAAVFVVIFLLSSRLVKLLVFLVDKFFNLLRFLPFSRLVNRLAGAVIGLLEGVFIAGLIVFISVKQPFSAGLVEAIYNSELARQLLMYVKILFPLMEGTLIKA